MKSHCSNHSILRIGKDSVVAAVRFHFLNHRSQQHTHRPTHTDRQRALVDDYYKQQKASGDRKEERRRKEGEGWMERRGEGEGQREK